MEEVYAIKDSLVDAFDDKGLSLSIEIEDEVETGVEISGTLHGKYDVVFTLNWDTGLAEVVIDDYTTECYLETDAIVKSVISYLDRIGDYYR